MKELTLWQLFIRLFKKKKKIDEFSLFYIKRAFRQGWVECKFFRTQYPSVADDDKAEREQIKEDMEEFLSKLLK